MALPVEDYALIGDLRTAALVGKDGSIDWLCLPRFDSPACFAALLGGIEHGHWRIAPRGGAKRARRRYRDGTLVLDTEFQASAGRATLTDFMPHREREERLDLVRIVRCDEGEVELDMDLTLRFDYGRVLPWVRRRSYGLHAVAGPDAVMLCSSVPLESRDFHTRARLRLRKGERACFCLVWHPSHRPEPEAIDEEELLEATVRWWRRWSGKLRYRGRWREAVKSSLVALRALTYEPTGAIVAAPTTSLPEKLGGERNWDYRYCWLRDGAITLRALLTAGYQREAQEWREWLLRSVSGLPSEIQIMYGIAGERRLDEFELPWLPGYRGSRPVRVGNDAHAQLQHDVAGEVMLTFEQARAAGLRSVGEAWRIETGLLDWLESNWRKPGAGIWEMRTKPRRHTHSAVMSWAALRCGIRAVERHGLKGPVERWRAACDEIKREILERGYDAKRKAFVQYYGGRALDAALLRMPVEGFLRASDPRVKSTIAAIERELCVEGFVRRYDTRRDVDGLAPGEGTFLACTFWLADAQWLSGQHKKARATFERALSVRNDVGLLAEEYDPIACAQLGNFPQGFSHLALVNSACLLTRRHKGKVDL